MKSVLQTRSDALFLFKDFNAHGKPKTDSRLMANYDIASIFCENLPNGCLDVPKNILKNYPKDRELIHTIPTHWETRKHKSDEWLLDKVYKIKDSIYEAENWVDVTDDYKSGKFVPKNNH